MINRLCNTSIDDDNEHPVSEVFQKLAVFSCMKQLIQAALRENAILATASYLLSVQEKNIPNKLN